MPCCWSIQRCTSLPQLPPLPSAPPLPQLNTWFLGSRDPETGQYADLPDAAKGGSAAIVNPPPPEPTPEEAAAAAARAAKEGGAKGGAKAGAKAGKGGKGGKGGAPEAPPMSFAFLEGLRGAVQHYLDVWGEYEEADPTLALRESALPAAVPGKGSCMARQ